MAVVQQFSFPFSLSFEVRKSKSFQIFEIYIFSSMFEMRSFREKNCFVPRNVAPMSSCRRYAFRKFKVFHSERALRAAPGRFQPCYLPADFRPFICRFELFSFEAYSRDSGIKSSGMQPRHVRVGSSVGTLRPWSR